MPTNRNVHLAVCADQHILPGLHVTLSTTLRHLAGDRGLNIYLVENGLSQSDINTIKDTLDIVGRKYRLSVLPAPTDAFHDLKGIRGNVMTWARFMLPSLLPDVNRLLYLDSDLAVLTDVSPVFEFDLEGAPTALVDSGGGTMRTSIERDLFDNLGFDMNHPYYNAGVMVMDLDAWRNGFADRGLAFARQHGGSLGAADQTAINYLMYGFKYKSIPAKYNIILYAADSFPEAFGTAARPADGIYHFLGAPKPWDLFGEWVYRHGQLFEDALSKTALAGWKSYARPSISSIKTALRNSRSYVRAFRGRL